MFSTVAKLCIGYCAVNYGVKSAIGYLSPPLAWDVQKDPDIEQFAYLKAHGSELIPVYRQLTTLVDESTTEMRTLLLTEIDQFYKYYGDKLESLKKKTRIIDTYRGKAIQETYCEIIERFKVWIAHIDAQLDVEERMELVQTKIALIDLREKVQKTLKSRLLH